MASSEYRGLRRSRNSDVWKKHAGCRGRSCWNGEVNISVGSQYNKFDSKKRGVRASAYVAAGKGGWGAEESKAATAGESDGRGCEEPFAGDPPVGDIKVVVRPQGPAVHVPFFPSTESNDLFLLCLW